MITTFSFVASANCILYAGAKAGLFPILTRKPSTWIPKGWEAKITPRTKAILVVHVFSVPADMDGFHRIATENGGFLIEDACEAIGARWREGGRRGTWEQWAPLLFTPTNRLLPARGGNGRDH